MVERQPQTSPTDPRLDNWNQLDRAYDAEAERRILVDTAGNFIKTNQSSEGGSLLGVSTSSTSDFTIIYE